MFEMTPETTRPEQDRPAGDSWTFLSNHSHVLLCIAQNNELRTREIAMLVGITERAVQRIVSDLVDAGYLIRGKRGRCNIYEIVRNLPLRHPLESHRTVGGLLDYLKARES